MNWPFKLGAFLMLSLIAFAKTGQADGVSWRAILYQDLMATRSATELSHYQEVLMETTALERACLNQDKWNDCFLYLDQREKIEGRISPSMATLLKQINSKCMQVTPGGVKGKDTHRLMTDKCRNHFETQKEIFEYKKAISP